MKYNKNQAKAWQWRVNQTSAFKRKLDSVLKYIEDNNLKLHKSRFMHLMNMPTNWKEELEKPSSQSGKDKIELMEIVLQGIEDDLIDKMYQHKEGQIRLYDRWYAPSTVENKQDIVVNIANVPMNPNVIMVKDKDIDTEHVLGGVLNGNPTSI